MTRRPTIYCDRCESTVYADDIHSCYDAKLVRTVADAERRVVEAAIRETVAEERCEEIAGDDISEGDALAISTELLDAVEARGEAVRHLRAVRDGEGGA